MSCMCNPPYHLKDPRNCTRYRKTGTYNPSTTQKSIKPYVRVYWIKWGSSSGLTWLVKPSDGALKANSWTDISKANWSRYLLAVRIWQRHSFIRFLLLLMYMSSICLAMTWRLLSASLLRAPLTWNGAEPFSLSSLTSIRPSIQTLRLTGRQGKVRENTSYLILKALVWMGS